MTMEKLIKTEFTAHITENGDVIVTGSRGLVKRSVKMKSHEYNNQRQLLYFQEKIEEWFVFGK